MKRFFMLLILAVIAIGVPENTYAQRNKMPKGGKRTSKSKKEFAKVKEDRDAKAAQAQEEGKKQHLAIQDKATRKRMKQSRKKAKRNNNNRRDPFFVRLFRRRR